MTADSSISSSPVDDLPVLFVDDEEQVLHALRRTVKGCHWESVFVSEPRRAMELVAGREFAAVVSDYRMPAINGVELLSAVRDRWPLAERILLTGFADTEALERGINDAGISRFMRKPWQGEALISLLNAATDQSRLRREHAVLVERVRNRNEELSYLNRLLTDRVAESDRVIHVFRRRWDVALNAISDAIVVVSPEYRMEGGNAAAGLLAGGEIASLEGNICHEKLFDRSLPCDGCPLAGEPGRIVKVDGGSQRVFDARAYPVPGETDAHLCVYRDITEALVFEREAAHMESMAAMGRLAGGVAHELNNPLHVILTFVQLAQQPSTPPAKLERYHQVIKESAVRCRDIIQTMRGLARQGDSIGRRPTDLVEVCNEALALFKAEPGASIERCWEAGQPFMFEGNANQIHQVVVNLIQNAIDAGPAEGRIRVGITIDGPELVCFVEDDGPGVPAADRERIFEPFFTTKPEGIGTGLGLAISHRILDDLGGSLRVGDGSLTGARFEARLPRLQESDRIKGDDS